MSQNSNRLFALALIILALITLTTLVACGPPPPPSVDDVTLTRAVDSSFKATDPATAFKSSDTKIIASVKVSNVVVGSKVEARWYLGDKEFTEARGTITEDKGGSGYYGMSISSTAGFPAGDYKVEIYLNDNVVKTISFQVQ